MKITCINQCDPNQIQLDLVETILVVRNTFLNKVSLRGQYEECEGCNLRPLCEVPSNTTSCVIVDTRYNLEMEVLGQLGYKCSWVNSFMEHYQYDWDLSGSCNWFYNKRISSHPHLPIIFFLFGILVLVTAWITVQWVFDKLKRCFDSTKMKRNYVEAIDIFNMDRRVIAVDVFRGVCVVFMIFINYGGGRYWFFEPAVWNGITIADLIFPWFLWLSGFSMSVSFQKKLIRGVTRLSLLVKTTVRSIIFFGIGLLLNSHEHGSSSISNMRLFGVLQRIGVTYFMVGILEIALMKRKYKMTEACFMEDIRSSWSEWFIIFLISTFHSVVTFFISVPGCGRGYVGPGGLHKQGQYLNCTGGIAGYIDRKILGEHIFQHGNHKMMYETNLDYDSEGLLGILTSVIMMMLGVQAGRVLYLSNELYQRTSRWGFLGTNFCLFGGGLCGFSKNSGFIPLNSKLWSLSFVYTLAGFAFFIFAVLFFLIDGKKHWNGFPFHYPGMNPLLLYILHELFRNAFPFKWEPQFNTHAEYFTMNIIGAVIWMVFSYYLHRKKLYVSI